jgi:hypothetical protein
MGLSVATTFMVCVTKLSEFVMGGLRDRIRRESQLSTPPSECLVALTSPHQPDRSGLTKLVGGVAEFIGSCSIGTCAIRSS